MSPAEATKTAAKKPTTKKTTKKAPAKAATPSKGATIAQATRELILKGTKQKPADTKSLAFPFVSTGSTLMDHMIGGNLTSDGKTRKCPGYPRRKVTEIYGPEASGKTTLALHGVVEAQRDGGVAMFLDFEHALDHDYARNVGVDYGKDRFLYYRPENLEQGLKMMYAGITFGVDLIVLDSIAALVTAKELEKSLEKEERIGERARQMSKFLPKLVMWLSTKNAEGRGTAIIFINQVRESIDMGGGKGRGTNETTPGGKALKFFACLRIRAARIGSESIKRKDPFTGKEQSFPYGNKTMVKLVKTKIDATSGWSTNIFIRFGKGIDDHYSMIEAAAGKRVVQKKGGWYSYEEHRFQGRDKFRDFLMENPKVYEEIREKTLESIRSIKLKDIPEPDGVDAVLADMGKEFGEDFEEDEFESEDEEDEEEDINDSGGDDEEPEDLELGE